METSTFPHDLLQARRDWNTTYRALASAGPENNTTLRRRLLRLSVHLWWHPDWTTTRSTPAARIQLRQLAHSTDPASTP